jgi:hypothetical protein
VGSLKTTARGVLTLKDNQSVWAEGPGTLKSTTGNTFQWVEDKRWARAGSDLLVLGTGRVKFCFRPMQTSTVSQALATSRKTMPVRLNSPKFLSTSKRAGSSAVLCRSLGTTAAAQCPFTPLRAHMQDLLQQFTNGVKQTDGCVLKRGSVGSSPGYTTRAFPYL